MRDRGKTQSAVFLRDDHAEEAVRFQERPDAGGQIALLVDLPVVELGAQLLHRAVHERLFLGGQFLRGKVEQLVPMRQAGEQLAVPPHGAGVERNTFGFTQARQHRRHQFHGEARHQQAPQRRQAEDQGQHDQRDRGDLEQQRRSDAADAPADQPDSGGAGPCIEAVAEEQQRAEQDQREDEREDHGRTAIKPIKPLSSAANAEKQSYWELRRSALLKLNCRYSTFALPEASKRTRHSMDCLSSLGRPLSMTIVDVSSTVSADSALACAARSFRSSAKLRPLMRLPISALHALAAVSLRLGLHAPSARTPTSRKTIRVRILPSRAQSRQ